MSEKKKQDWSRVPGRIWAFIYFLGFCIFSGVVIRANVLPGKYLYPILTVSGIISIVLLMMLCSRKLKRGWKITAFVLSFLMAGIAGYVGVHLGETASFLGKITRAETVQYEKYYVLTGKNSALKTKDDLTNGTVSVFVGKDEGYRRAESHLKKCASVKFLRGTNLSGMALTMSEQPRGSMLVSTAHYQALKVQIPEWKEKLRVLTVLQVKKDVKDLSKNVDVKEHSFNVYLSGLDTSGSINTQSRSDVNMIITVNPKTHQLLLTSIPRDYQIRLTEKDNAADKLTHTGIYGIQQTLESAEDLTGLDMNYYVKVNYSTVRRFIDAIGGIDVDSDYAFSTSGQAYHEFRKGHNHLNGDQALAFARERHAFEDGDLQRNRDQEKIMTAILEKAAGSTTILKHYSEILSACGEYLETSMSRDEISDLVKMQLDGGYHWTIHRQSMSGESTMAGVYSMGNQKVYVMMPDQENVKACVAQIRRVAGGKDFTGVKTDKKKK
ncbi:LCP family protein [uncultured Eubacterium sp.]|uniref:LCP family protein n=1 Tax=uncultured Eubacterium sp. TaxID=165185 RepID=UPI002597590C|nr:LCP family protein [uncultured Eubacterium sp.]